MSVYGEQLRKIGYAHQDSRKRPHWAKRRWYTYAKVTKRRSERRRAKHDPECVPQYRKYYGYD